MNKDKIKKTINVYIDSLNEQDSFLIEKQTEWILKIKTILKQFSVEEAIAVEEIHTFSISNRSTEILNKIELIDEAIQIMQYIKMGKKNKMDFLNDILNQLENVPG